MSDHKLDDKNRDFIPFDPSIISEIMDALDSSEKQKVIAITKDLSAADIADIINLLPRSEIKSFIEFIENDFNPEILSELEEHIREEVINFLGPTHVAEFLQKLETDDAVYY